MSALRYMAAAVGTVINGLGWVSAGFFASAGLITTYDVIARYFFDAPTYWSLEIAQHLLIWGVFLGLPFVQRGRRMIAVDVLPSMLKGRALGAQEVLSVLVVMAVAIALFVLGLEAMIDDLATGRQGASLLALPAALAAAALPVGMGMLALQCLLDLVSLLRRAEAITPVVED
ncbi:MAG: TRAP transporter small permease [Roseovarius sp.]|nr:TRAP transporter small permease [Roseovarius sp.]